MPKITLQKLEKMSKCKYINIFIYIKPWQRQVQPVKKNESNNKSNICKILHIPFDMLWYLLLNVNDYVWNDLL